MPPVCSASRAAPSSVSSRPSPRAISRSAGRRKRAELEHRPAVALRRAAQLVGQLGRARGAAGEHREDALADEPPQREEEPVQRGGVDPLDVVDDEEQRLGLLQLTEQLQHAQPMPDGQRVVRTGGWGAECAGRLADAAEELVEDTQPDVALERLSAHPDAAAVPRARRELGHERGLAGPSRAGDGGDPGAPAAGALDRRGELRQLRGSSRQPGRVEWVWLLGDDGAAHGDGSRRA